MDGRNSHRRSCTIRRPEISLSRSACLVRIRRSGPERPIACPQTGKRTQLWLQNLFKVEFETEQDRIATQSAWLIQMLGRFARAIDNSAVLDRIEEPSQPRTVSDVFLHLCFDIGNAIGGRSQLDHKIRADLRERLLLCFR